MYSIVQPGDHITGLYNTTAGCSTGGSNGTYPDCQEAPQYAIDDNVGTKYVNFGSGGCVGCTPARYGEKTGFYTTAANGTATVATGLLFATGNDSPNRDPIIVTLEGSNATSDADLNMGSSWTRIYNGSSGLATDPGRKSYGVTQRFSNTLAFRSYRLLVSLQRGDDNAVQYSEAKILGNFDFLMMPVRGIHN